jgi:hypothetical protein
MAFSSPESRSWSFSLYQAIEHTFDMLPLPSWLKRLNIPLNIIHWMFRYPRVSCASLLIFSRMTAFLIFEFPRLEFIAQRVRYERFAQSFDFIDSSARPKPQRRFGKELLYQYQPLWTLFIPAGISAGNLIAATWPRARPWLIYIPHSPKIDTRLLSVVGKALIHETVLRVSWELAWRWLRMDIPTTKSLRLSKPGLLGTGAETNKSAPLEG